MSSKSTRRVRPRLDLECLEAREVPAINIVIDYSHDTTGFFTNNPTAEATLQLAANDLASQISASLPAITPGSGNTWSETFYDPATGAEDTVNNPSVAANTIVVYAGARVLGGSQASQGGFGGYDAGGSQSWLNSLNARGVGGGGLLWGGSVAFDTTTNWYFGAPASGLQSNQEDFFTCATHELAHVLGLGTSSVWFNQVSNSTFTGAHAEAIYGGAVPVTWGAGDELNDVTVNGVTPVMNLDLSPGVRTAPFTPLDWALMEDIGWSVSVDAATPPPPVAPPVVPPPPVAPPTVPPPPVAPPVVPPPPVAPPTVPPPPVAPPVVPPPPVAPPTVPPPPVSPVTTGASDPTVLVSEPDGVVGVYAQGSNGTLAYTGQSFTPFPGFTGSIRTAVGDFTGNGDTDYAFVTGPGTAAEVRIIDGTTGANVVGPTQVLGGFGGGAFLAAGDIDGDGTAELAVGADAGGLPTIEIYKVVDGQLSIIASFLAFSSSDNRGVRVAMGNLGGTGIDDLIVGAGPGGLPRVEIYNGQALAAGQATLLDPAFLAFGSTMLAGVNVSAANVTGAGYDDLIVSQGAGGSSKVRVWDGNTITDNPTMPASALAPYQTFFANGTSAGSGTLVVPVDFGDNGIDELVVSPDGSDDWLRVLTVASTGVTASAPVFITSGS